MEELFLRNGKQFDLLTCNSREEIFIFKSYLTFSLPRSECNCPNTSHTFLCQLVLRIWCYIKAISLVDNVLRYHYLSA